MRLDDDDISRPPAACDGAARARPQLPAHQHPAAVHGARELPDRRAGAPSRRRCALQQRAPSQGRGDRRSPTRSTPPVSPSAPTCVAAHLSHGEQRQLEIAMLIASGAKLLILDEPLAGMGPEETGRVTALLRDLAADHTDHADRARHGRDLRGRRYADGAGRGQAAGAWHAAEIRRDPRCARPISAASARRAAHERARRHRQPRRR